MQGDGAKSGDEGQDVAGEGAAEDGADSPCCSTSVQMPTISVIMLRIASAVLLSPAAAAGGASGSAKKLPV